jgi:signal transduction histidine kinase
MDGRWRRWAAERPLAVDSALAAGALLVELVIAGAVRPDEDWVAVAGFSVLGAVGIALRRVASWWAVGLTLASLASVIVVGRSSLTSVLASVVLTYTFAARSTLRTALAAAVALWVPVLVVGMIAGRFAGETGPSPALLVLNYALLAAVAFFVGRSVNNRRASTRALEERARTAEANQEALAAQAVAEERRRIARELHDVVAHHVSVMGVLATGARRVLRRDPDSADEALSTIEGTSRTTLRELRRLLDVLRTEAEPAADLAPQPGLAAIEALAEQVREAGLPVRLDVRGTPAPLDPGVALTIYRIVQEALTNALKHAGTATAVVRLDFGVSWLVVEVADTGRGPTPDGGRLGHGLVGMRERVALYGGTLRTGPRPGGGFRVYARMPMEDLGAPTTEGAA